MFRYYSTQRPIGPGTFPGYPDNIVNFDNRQEVPGIGPAWGYLEYFYELPEADAQKYELRLRKISVREHMKEAGYDPDAARNADRLAGQGTMECEYIKLRTFKCRPFRWEEMLAVEAVAMVRFTDGGMHPHPIGWPDSMEASITAYFPLKGCGTE